MKSIVAFSFIFAVALAFPSDDLISFEIENRITGGIEARLNQFPYQVGMVMTKMMGNKVINTWCGGSLISEETVLTAAHCLHEALSAIVFLGAHNRVAKIEAGRVLIPVTPDNWVIHEKYNTIVTENDIALINLPIKVPLTNKIQTINLPTRKQANEKFENVMGVISGWGRVGDGPSDGASPVLRYVHRSVLPNEDCEHYFPMFRSSQICVDGSNKKSACAGDSGGPLAITEVDGSNTLIGLTSYGSAAGCQKNYPISYTRVSSYLDWISRNSAAKIRS